MWRTFALKCSTCVDGWPCGPVFTPLHKTDSPISGGVFVAMFESCRKLLDIHSSTSSVLAAMEGGMAGGVFGASLTSEEGRRQRNCSAVDFKFDNGRWSNFDTIIGALAFTLESKARHLYCKRTRWQWTGAGWGRQLGCWHLLRHRNARVALAAILCSVACLAACAACVNAIWTRSPCAPAIRLASDAARQIVLHTEGRALWLHDC